MRLICVEEGKLSEGTPSVRKDCIYNSVNETVIDPITALRNNWSPGLHYELEEMGPKYIYHHSLFVPFEPEPDPIIEEKKELCV